MADVDGPAAKGRKSAIRRSVATVATAVLFLFTSMITGRAAAHVDPTATHPGPGGTGVHGLTLASGPTGGWGVTSTGATAAPPLPGTSYISPLPNANCPSAAAPAGVAFTASVPFTLPSGAVDPSIRVLVHADDAVAIRLNGNVIGGQAPAAVTANSEGAPEAYANAEFGPEGFFVAGANTLSFELRNYGGPCALDFLATVRFALPQCPGPSNGGGIFTGGPGNDTLNGGPGGDVIAGGDGNDTINGGGGDDTIVGGSGDDTIDGGPGHDCVVGQTGHDRLFGGVDDDLVVGEDGSDNLCGDTNSCSTLTGGDDILDGGLGGDQLVGDGGNDIVHGGPDGDILFGGFGDDALSGGHERDLLFGSPGDDTVYGGSGDDSLGSASGNNDLDAYNGGPGADHLGTQDGDSLDTLWGPPTPLLYGPAPPVDVNDFCFADPGDYNLGGVYSFGCP